MSEQDIYDIVIVGGGSAGLFGSARVSELMHKGKKVLLLEKTGSLGNKLCLSGNSQCNFTNGCDMKDFRKHYGENGNFLKDALYQLSNIKLIDFFSSKGLETIMREDKKVFPKSLISDDIKKTLISQAKKYPVDIKVNSKLEKIEYKADGIILGISIKKSDNKYYEHKIKTKYLILCTGGASYPETGSTGDVIKLLKNFNIKTHYFKPALTFPLINSINNGQTIPFDLGHLSGVTFPNAFLSIIRNDKTIYTQSGALLFTHIGLSGPLILDNSRYFEKGDSLRVYLTDFKDKSELEKKLFDLIEKYPKRKISNIINQLGIPERVIEYVLKGFNTDKKSAELSKSQRKSLVNSLFCIEFLVLGFESINSAMCSKGGVDLSEIDKKNMMLKKLPNVFVAGECIDIDGDTGGYNIHAAFATVNLIIKYLSSLM
ncbi:MAG: aminoacetone oxidase family FAD-binding enzyme [Candidatus Cloacimonetes bacterium]|nr:aminoacetone oxidase family FAD-binding enzyme [Candidatus Cloacimonadota bacterium]